LKYRIAFDIDGVLVDLDLNILGMIPEISNISLEKRLNLFNRFYYSNRPLNLNPLLFLHKDDELYFITGRNKAYQKITKEWKNKYYPQAKLIILDHEEYSNDKSYARWLKKQAKLKAKALKKYKIDVYFEDSPIVVQELRRLCPKVKILQYGERLNV